MYYGTTENIRTKKLITEALFSLLKKKNFSELTVTDIIKESGVARSTYYRNFNTKESIMEQYIEDIHDDIISNDEYENIEIVFTRENIIRGFERTLTHFLKNKSYILTIYRNGFGYLIQDILNKYIEQSVGDMPAHSIERYKLYFISGATFNVLIHWLEQGAEESPYAIASICANYLSGSIITK